ncbi:GNAT family N-acetyltransferase [Flavobacterium soyangense]|uniref:GNAT family N-acetyltransferase n=1 Tax=Flavobacterium soyangense TaxID=2023265 RepID=A0A930XX95_9FLAO|nr:GNAT family N-acetyltransferase [Flavobacterium soyangense]MBF2710012.1 GNAT family N-acetyltransferase [Flavobacterium soyangense]
MESCRFEGDDLETTQHFGLYLKQELVGIISLFKKSNSDIPVKNQYQIRGMAALENHRKKDFGKELLLYSEKQCKNQNMDLIWFNPRIEASDFYQKNGKSKNKNSI